MTDADSARQPQGLPHEIDHRHADVTGGWLRAATFGAMDGLVSNTALIAGVAASGSAQTVVVSGVAGVLAGAFSMALGEYTSVTTANEQIESEVRVERRAFAKHPQAERAELIGMLQAMGMTKDTATVATDEIHRDEARALTSDPVSNENLGLSGQATGRAFLVAGRKANYQRTAVRAAAHPLTAPGWPPWPPAPPRSDSPRRAWRRCAPGACRRFSRRCRGCARFPSWFCPA